MAKTYAQIARQIEALKQQADAQKKREGAGVIARIKEAIAFYGLTAQDLGLSSEPRPAVAAQKPATAGKTRGGKRTAPARKKPSARPSMVRFQDDQGNRWTGMGRKPGWLVAGLGAGKTLDDFAVKADSPAVDASAPA